MLNLEWPEKLAIQITIYSTISKYDYNISPLMSYTYRYKDMRYVF